MVIEYGCLASAGSKRKGQNIELYCPARHDEAELDQNGDNLTLNRLSEYDGLTV